MATQSEFTPGQAPLATATAAASRTARIVGTLLITATAASLASTALLGPVLTGTDYLGGIYAAQGRILGGALLTMLSAFTSASIAIALYPLLRAHSRGLALGSVGMRVIEASMYLVSALGPILLVVLSQQHARAAPRPPYDETLGALLKALRDQASIIGSLAFYLGAGMYYLIFRQSRLVPRWLSDWGLLGVTLGLASGILVVLGVTAVWSPFMLTMNLPIAVQEMVLAVWLLLRGFATPVHTGSEPMPALI